MRRFNKAILLAGFLVAVGIGSYELESHIASKGSGNSQEGSKPQAPVYQGRGAAQPVRKFEHPRVPKGEAQNLWEAFSEKFGPDLNSGFTADHRLVRVRSEDGAGTPAENFKAGDRASALRRGEEIVKDARELLGLNPRFPLRVQNVTSDEISTQIEWVQTFDGVPVHPFGGITVQLDAHGGLRGLYSNYISDPIITNAPSLDESSARSSALGGVHFKVEHPEEVGKGQLILFAEGPQQSEQPVNLTYAYRFWIDGRDVIVDAADGKVLSERDHRQF